MPPITDDALVNEVANKLQNSLTLQQQSIDAAVLIKRIQAFLAGINELNQLADFDPLLLHQYSADKFDQLKREYAALKRYLWNPSQISNAMPFNGVNHIHQRYEAALLRASLILRQLENPTDDLSAEENAVITPKKARTAARGFGLLARLYKMKKAYLDIASGKKFRKSQTIKLSKKPLFQQDNPIQTLSSNNIQRLIKKLSEHGNLPWGLRDDEVELFDALRTLDLRCQHATNFFYPMANAGSMDSLTELRRRQPQYISPFSTNGNLSKLGNGGFVFFRVYVPGCNGDQTRYGDTQISTPIDMLQQDGWISLHDQLVPFSTVNAKRLYWGSRLLRTARTCDIKNNTKEKGLRDGIEYCYRESSIPDNNPFDGTLDTQARFSTSLKRTLAFTEEIFYGADILLGIALSTIYELRLLETCGFRALILNEFTDATVEERNLLLGELIKGFFRIEGKYPVALRLEETLPSQLRYTPLTTADEALDHDHVLHIDNPDGDGRYNTDLSINANSMHHALLKQEKYQLENEISVVRRQCARFKKDKTKSPLYENRKNAIASRLKAVTKELLQYEDEVEKLQQNLSKWVETPARLNKISLEKMALIDESFSDLLKYKLVTIEQLIAAPMKKLRVIADKNICELIIDEKFTFEEAIALSYERLLLLQDYFYRVFDEGYLDDIALIAYVPLKKLILMTDEQLLEAVVNGHATFTEMLMLDVTELQALIDCESLDTAFTEHGYLFQELIQLYREDPEHLHCLTAADLADYIIDCSPNISKLMLDYANEFDVDMSFVRDTIGKSEWGLIAPSFESEATTDEEDSASEYESENENEDEDNRLTFTVR